MLLNRKSKTLMLVVLICGMLLGTACQKTPGQEVVVNESDISLDELVLKKACANDEWTQTEDSIIWEQTKSVDTEIGESTVSINIDVDMPDYPRNVPVYIIKPGEFSEEFLKKTSEYLFDGEIYGGTLTKKDILTQKLTFQKDISEHTILNGYEKEVDGWLEYYDEEYNKAPDDNSAPIFNENSNHYFYLKSYTDKNEAIHFKVYRNRGTVDGVIFRGIGYNEEFYYINVLSAKDTQAKEAELTYKQALSAANNAMTDLFDVPYSMVRTRIIDKINFAEYIWNDMMPTSKSQAYSFYFTREYDGVPSLLIDPAPIVMTETTQYSKPYTREYVCVIVDDSGIVYMKYISFSDTIDLLNDSVKIMPFDKVLEQFKKSIFYHSLWGNNAEISITKIEFGMVREPIKDNPDEYMMVPAWNFIGEVKTNFFEGNTHEYESEEQEKSILVVNAINGSIVTDYESITDPK